MVAPIGSHAVGHVGSELHFVELAHFWLVAFDGISFDCLLFVAVAAAVGSAAAGVVVAAAIVVGVIVVVVAVAHLVLRTPLLVPRPLPQALRYIHESDLLFGRPVEIKTTKNNEFLDSVYLLCLYYIYLSRGYDYFRLLLVGSRDDHETVHIWRIG